MLNYNKKLKQLSRNLRNNLTDAEKLLWSKIRMKQLKDCQFYRQKIIGKYSVDFYCHSAKLAIELDGGQHYSDEGMEKDRARDAYLASLGVKVLRFSDKEMMMNTDGVLKTIWSCL